MTRSHDLKKVTALFTLSILCMSPNSYAQFNKFKSKTRFKNPQVRPQNNAEIAEGFNDNADQLEAIDVNDTRPAPNNSANNSRNSGTNSSDFEQNSNNQNTFGSRPVMRPKNAKTSKFVFCFACGNWFPNRPAPPGSPIAFDPQGFPSKSAF